MNCTEWEDVRAQLLSLACMLLGSVWATLMVHAWGFDSAWPMDVRGVLTMLVILSPTIGAFIIALFIKVQAYMSRYS